VSFGADGTLRYTPERGFVGTVELVYRAFDGRFLSDAVTVTIVVFVPDNVPSVDANPTTENSMTETVSTTATTSSQSTGNATTSATPVAPAGMPSSSTSSTVSVTQAAPSSREVLKFAPQEGRVENAVSLFGDSSIRSSGSVRVLNASLTHFEALTHRGDEGMSMSRQALHHDSDGAGGSVDSTRALMDSVLFKTVLGTGVIIWLAQGAQLAATLVSASPAWLHIDPLAVMPSIDTKNGKKEELSAGERIFDK
jgi:hypothetical protein